MAREKKWLYVELPVTEYLDAWKLQQDLHAARTKKHVQTDIILSLEHNPVFTLGRRGRRENLNVTDDFLQGRGIAVVQVERGGDITYHGPGQIVVYPIINLDRARLDIGGYITLLEKAMLQTAVAWSVPAETNTLNRGIWVGDRKIGSIGIAVRRGVTLHGLALNVDLDLEPFDWINPCGLHGVKATSMKRELSQDLSLASVRKNLMRNIEKVFGIELIPTDLQQLIEDVESEKASVLREKDSQISVS